MADVALQQCVTAFVQTIENSNIDTFNQRDRVAQLCVAMGKKLSLNIPTLKGLAVSAVLHDVGMITVGNSILTKSDELSHAESGIIHRHPEIGYDILRNLRFPWPVAEAVRQHHEHVDGTGYPHGLLSEEILPEAKIILLAATVESITSIRPYRHAANLSTAIEELEKSKGSHYDSDAVDSFLRLINKGRLKVEGWEHVSLKKGY